MVTRRVPSSVGILAPHRHCDKKFRKMDFPQHEKAKGFVVLVPLGAVSRHGGAVGFGTARGFSYDVKTRVCILLSVCLDHHT